MIRFRARMELKNTASGGRRGPIFSGYRSLLRHQDRYVSAGFDLAGVSELEPGGCAEADVRIPALTPRDWSPQSGDRFEVFETPGRSVAECIVLAESAETAQQPAELVKAD